jgi:hypothetical protein
VIVHWIDVAEERNKWQDWVAPAALLPGCRMNCTSIDSERTGLFQHCPAWLWNMYTLEIKVF